MNALGRAPMSPSAKLVSAAAAFDAASVSSAELVALSLDLSAKLMEIETTLATRKEAEAAADPVIEVRFMLTEGVRFQRMDASMEDLEDEDDCEDFDDDDKNKIYIGSMDEDMEIDFEEFGGICEYEEYCRRGSAKVYLNGKDMIGRFDCQLISRDPLGENLSFWEVCDAQSAELEQIASELFEEGGELKGALKRQCASEESNRGGFLYIQNFSIEAPAPYNTDAIACKAIKEFCQSEVLHNIEDVPVTLAMYIPETRKGNSLKRQDKKKWVDAGFTCISTANSDYLFMELSPKSF